KHVDKDPIRVCKASQRPCASLYRVTPQQVLHAGACNLNRFGKPKKADNDGKVEGGTEGSRQQNTDKPGVTGENRDLQAPACCEDDDGSDQLWTYGAHDESTANSYRAARITD